MDLTQQLITEEEGRSPCAYPDSRGFLTIAIGCPVDRRLRWAGLCDAAIDAQFAHDVAGAASTAASIPNFDALNDVQQAALKSVCFQLGAQVLDWKDFISGMTAKDWGAAAAALMESRWAREQTPRRAARETQMIQSGTWLPK